MRKSIYVACIRKEGGKGWLQNPKPFFDGKICLAFTASAVTAGAATESFEHGMESRGFVKILHDGLDQLKIPWAEDNNPRFGVKIIAGKAHEMFLMDISLTGPLPWDIAWKTEGVIVKTPVKVMSRYGG